VGELLFGVLATVAERDLIVARTKEGMAVAKARGRLKGRQSKLTAAQQKLVSRHMEEAELTPQEVGEMFGVSRQTVYRVVQKAREGVAA
jgi:DNA invertase Pin-like site-specific DNA recombinase